MFARVDAQLPEIVRGITHELGEHIDQCIDAKLLIMRHFREDPALMNSVFLEMGKKELRFMKNSGFYFGVPAGLILAVILHYVPHWWVLPLGGIVIGYVVNFIAVWAVFEPIEPKRIGPFTLQGLFLKRQPEAGACFADIVARKIITHREHRRRAHARPAVGPHPADAADGARAGGRQGHRPGQGRRPRRHGHPRVRPHQGLARQRGHQLQCRVRRRRVQ